MPVGLREVPGFSMPEVCQRIRLQCRTLLLLVLHISRLVIAVPVRGSFVSFGAR
jgi:hypothetical protein